MINEWLDRFKDAWVSKDVERVLSLFTDDVVYWETPYKQLQGKDALREEWNAVLSQQSINLDFEVFSSMEDRHTVVWKLTYVGADNMQQNWSGIYLIELDGSGQCRYFHQTGEKR